jgi:hypothetical protein
MIFDSIFYRSRRVVVLLLLQLLLSLISDDFTARAAILQSQSNRWRNQRARSTPYQNAISDEFPSLLRKNRMFPCSSVRHLQNWQQITKLTAMNVVGGANGSSRAISPNTVVVGASGGAAYVYRYSEDIGQ